MKNVVAPSQVQMDQESLKHLLTEVKETLATDIVLPVNSSRKFKSVDMWKIRRKAKLAVEMFKG